MSKELAVLKYLVDTLRQNGQTRELLLPSEAKLVRTLKVSRTTVRKAFARLEEHRLIERTPGRGTRLIRHVEEWEWNKLLRSAEEELDSRGMYPSLANVIVAQRSYKIIFFHDCPPVNPCMVKNLEGVRAAAAPRNHRIILGKFRVEYSMVNRKWSREVWDTDADGMIILATFGDEEMCNFDSVRKPYVMIGNLNVNNSIMINGSGSYDYVLRRLILSGHRHIAILSYSVDPYNANLADRAVCGWRRYDPHYAGVECHENIDDLDALLQSHPEWTAIYLTEDHKMAELLAALRRRGRTPGRDIEVVGLTNNDLPPELPPEVAQIALDQYGAGVLALRTLEQMLDTGARAFPPISLSGLYIPAEKRR